MKRWKTFQNKEDSSPTSSFRRHLKNHHQVVWEQECKRLNIQIRRREEDAPMPDVPEAEPFTREGLLKRLIKFITSDDQVRYISLMLGDPQLTEIAVDKCHQQSELPGAAYLHRWQHMLGRRHTSSNEVYEGDNRCMEAGTQRICG